MLIMDAAGGPKTMKLHYLCNCDYNNLLSLSRLLGGGMIA